MATKIMHIEKVVYFLTADKKKKEVLSEIKGLSQEDRVLLKKVFDRAIAKTPSSSKEEKAEEALAATILFKIDRKDGSTDETRVEKIKKGWNNIFGKRVSSRAILNQIRTIRHGRIRDEVRAKFSNDPDIRKKIGEEVKKKLKTLFARTKEKIKHAAALKTPDDLSKEIKKEKTRLKKSEALQNAFSDYARKGFDSARAIAKFNDKLESLEKKVDATSTDEKALTLIKTFTERRQDLELKDLKAFKDDLIEKAKKHGLLTKQEIAKVERQFEGATKKDLKRIDQNLFTPVIESALEAMIDNREEKIDTLKDSLKNAKGNQTAVKRCQKELRVIEYREKINSKIGKREKKLKEFNRSLKNIQEFVDLLKDLGKTRHSKRAKLVNTYSKQVPKEYKKDREEVREFSRMLTDLSELLALTTLSETDIQRFRPAKENVSKALHAKFKKVCKEDDVDPKEFFPLYLKFQQEQLLAIIETTRENRKKEIKKVKADLARLKKISGLNLDEAVKKIKKEKNV